MSYVSIYALTDPSDGRVRYVGKAKHASDRLRTHMKEARRHRGTHKLHWLSDLISHGLEPSLVILETCEEAVWQERERYWIAEMKRRGELLTNGTDGGDGGKMNTEVTLKLSALRKGLHTGASNPFFGRRHSKETKEKMSAFQRTRRHSEETRQKMSAAHRRRIDQGSVRRSVSDEQKEKIRAKLTGYKHSEETKVRMRERAKQQWADPDFREKMAAAKGVRR